MRPRGLVVAYLLISSAAVVHGQTTVLTLTELEQRALEHNPTLHQADAQVAVMQGHASQAGRWANPSIGYTAEEVSSSPTIRGGEHGFFIEQVFPISGKLSADKAIFERKAGEARAIREGQRLRVLNSVRTGYYEALIAARRVAVRQDLAALSDEAVGVSRRLANVGAADRTDILASEIEAEQARLGLEDARNEERRIWQRLAQVVGDPSLRVQPLAGDPDEGLPAFDLDVVMVALPREGSGLASDYAQRGMTSLR